jgi:hypothetical protein
MRRRPFLPCAEGERNDVRRAGVSEVPPVEARDLARGHERDRDEGIPNTLGPEHGGCDALDPGGGERDARTVRRDVHDDAHGRLIAT